MMLRTIQSVLHNFIDAQTPDELYAEAMSAKQLELGEKERELLNLFYAERKKELTQ